jgi:hypothetical protein
MKVKQNILDLVDKPTVRVTIAGMLKCGEQAVALQMRLNAPNGRMTKYDFLQALSEVTGQPIADLVEEGTIEEKDEAQR